MTMFFATFLGPFTSLLSLSILARTALSRPLIEGSDVYGDAFLPLTEHMVTPSHIDAPMTVSLIFRWTSRDTENNFYDEYSYVELPVNRRALLAPDDPEVSTASTRHSPSQKALSALSTHLAGGGHLPTHPRTAKILSVIYSPTAWDAYPVPAEVAQKITCYAYPKLSEEERVMERVGRWWKGQRREEGIKWRVGDGEVDFEDRWGSPMWFLQGRVVEGWECRDW